MFSYLEAKDGCILSVELGEGDTAFGGGYFGNGAYGLVFLRLKEAIGAGEIVTEEQSHEAKPYFSLVFTNRKSMAALIEALCKLYEKSGSD